MISLNYKLERRGLEGWTFQWINHWLDRFIQRVAANGSTFRLRHVTRVVPQVSVWGLVLFDIFINDKMRLSADYMKVSGEVDILKDRIPSRDMWTNKSGPMRTS